MRSAVPVALPTARATRSRWLAIVAACLLAAGCSGIKPMAFPDARENPTFPGLFTGEEGEWVIYRKDR
jgi:hypothetical protein